EAELEKDAQEVKVIVRLAPEEVVLDFVGLDKDVGPGNCPAAGQLECVRVNVGAHPDEISAGKEIEEAPNEIGPEGTYHAAVEIARDVRLFRFGKTAGQKQRRDEQKGRDSEVEQAI